MTVIKRIVKKQPHARAERSSVVFVGPGGTYQTIPISPVNEMVTVIMTGVRTVHTPVAMEGVDRREKMVTGHTTMMVIHAKVVKNNAVFAGLEVTSRIIRKFPVKKMATVKMTGAKLAVNLVVMEDANAKGRSVRHHTEMTIIPAKVVKSNAVFAGPEVTSRIIRIYPVKKMVTVKMTGVRTVHAPVAMEGVDRREKMVTGHTTTTKNPAKPESKFVATAVRVT